MRGLGGVAGQIDVCSCAGELRVLRAVTPRSACSPSLAGLSPCRLPPACKSSFMLVLHASRLRSCRSFHRLVRLSSECSICPLARADLCEGPGEAKQDPQTPVTPHRLGVSLGLRELAPPANARVDLSQLSVPLSLSSASSTRQDQVRRARKTIPPYTSSRMLGDQDGTGISNGRRPTPPPDDGNTSAAPARPQPV